MASALACKNCLRCANDHELVKQAGLASLFIDGLQLMYYTMFDGKDSGGRFLCIMKDSLYAEAANIRTRCLQLLASARIFTISRPLL